MTNQTTTEPVVEDNTDTTDTTAETQSTETNDGGADNLKDSYTKEEFLALRTEKRKLERDNKVIQKKVDFLSPKATEFDKLQTSQQTAEERIAALENEKAQLLFEREKTSLLKDSGLDPELWEVVNGSDADSVNAQINILIDKFAKLNVAKPPVATTTQGTSSTKAEDDSALAVLTRAFESQMQS